MPAFIYSTIIADADIDQLGHTNNAAYIRHCEEAAWAHSASLGLTMADWRQLDRAMAIHHAEYDYLLPSYAGDELEIETWLSDCDGRLSMRRNFSIQRNGEAILRGHWQLRCIRLSSGKLARFPGVFRQRYLPAVMTPA